MSCTNSCRRPNGRQAHCGACHQTFSGLTGFDRHRRGGTCHPPSSIAMHLDAYGVWRSDDVRPRSTFPTRP